MSAERNAVPADLKRQLRREAFFGCARCGYPFVQYHHILGYAVTGHVAEHMLALCPNCHDLVTKGAMSEREQRRLKSFPSNKLRGFVQGRFHSKASPLLVRFGVNYLVGHGYKITVDGEALLELHAEPNNALTISLVHYDSADRISLLIIENEWLLGDVAIQDLEAKPNFVRLRLDAEQPALILDARRRALEITGRLRFRGRGIDAGGGILIAGRGIAYKGIAFFDAGLVFDSGREAFDVRGTGKASEDVCMYAMRRDDSEREVLKAYQQWLARSRQVTPR
jgi:hypothetical protein